ncbi:uncharacterized protein At1g15400 [Rhodamnia argentea]|uniref:Uncharacterized protein At1g15400 n=1 Tax=Rhodamnia argentea TaxID=178133 RepID=A0A8B8NRU5_9MYRT|nr:uncharacterized protein At1g15400 [Rhodamnia argentea]
MAGLQRSEVSFRRQGSSGLVWDDRFIQAELRRKDELDAQEKAALGDDPNNTKPSSTPARASAPPPIETLNRSRSDNGAGGRGYRSGKVSQAIEPPSPKVSACGFCGAFGKQPKNRKTNPGKRRSR